MRRLLDIFARWCAVSWITVGLVAPWASAAGGSTYEEQPAVVEEEWLVRRRE